MRVDFHHTFFAKEKINRVRIETSQPANSDDLYLTEPNHLPTTSRLDTSAHGSGVGCCDWPLAARPGPPSAGPAPNQMEKTGPKNDC